MIISPRPLQFDIRRPDLDRPARSQGIHVSDLLTHVGLRMGHLKESNPEDSIQGHKDALAAYGIETDAYSPLLLKIALGLSWEDWYMPQVGACSPDSEFEYHPGELFLGGVSGSPDALEWQRQLNRQVVHECKFTYDHASTPVESKWLWIAQCRAYCFMCGTRWACLHVIYVNGMMKGNSQRARAGQPVGRAYDLEFTQEEIDRTWKSLMIAKRDLDEEMQAAEADARRSRFELVK